MAVTYAVRAFDTFLRGASFRLHIDNTAAMWSIAKGYSQVYNMNTRVSELRGTLAHLGAEFTIHYVRSAMNWADAPSRIFENKEKAQLSSTSGSVGETKYPTRITEGKIVSVSRIVRKKFH